MLADLLPKIAAEKFSERRDGSYHPRPSSAGPERCVRSLVYDALGTPRAPLGGRAIMVFDDSSWHEELTADWIRKSSFRLHSQQMAVEVIDAFPWLAGKTRCFICKTDRLASSLHGHIDGIITDLLGTDHLFEHKAINHFTFERYWKGEWPLDYLTQTALYIRSLQAVQPALDKGVLLIKNKNTSGYIEFIVRYNRIDDSLTIHEVGRSDGQVQRPNFVLRNITDEAVNKFHLVESYRAANTLPARPFEVGTDFPCGYCPWGKRCWDGYEKEFEALDKGADLGELTVKAGYYKQLQAEETSAKTEKEKVRSEILSDLSRLNATAGTAGHLFIEARLQKRKTLEKDLIPEDILAKAQKETSSVTLYVKKIKETSNAESARQTV